MAWAYLLIASVFEVVFALATDVRSLGTHMIRRGASLDEIGELLRHRSPNTTAIYAKVDLPALRRLALAWPGGGR